MARPNFISRFSLWAIFVLMLLYNSHRYILKMNFSGTSPTYSDTTPLWKVLRYILLAFFLLVFYATTKFQLRKIKLPPVMLGMAIFAAVVNVGNILIYKAVFSDELEYLLCIFLLFPLFYVSDSTMEYLHSKLKPALYWTSWYVVLTQAFVVGNFIATGRLPAMGYQGALVRFGGLWDDPNGFGFLCAFLAFYCFFERRYLLCVLMMGSVVATGSFTAIILVLVGVIYWSGIARLKVSKSIAYLVVSLIILVSVALVFYIDNVIKFIQVKQKSVAAHTSFGLDFSVIPLLAGPLQFHETWLWSFTLNYFPVSLAFDVLFFLFLLNATLNSKKSLTEFYMYIFLLGCSFLPLIYVFPLNCVFFIFLAMYIWKYKKVAIVGS